MVARQSFARYRKLLPKNLYLIFSISTVSFFSILLIYKEWNIYVTITFAIICNVLSRLGKDDILFRYRKFQKAVEDELLTTAKKQLALGEKENLVMQSPEPEENEIKVINDLVKAFDLALTLVDVNQTNKDIQITYVCTNTETLRENIQEFLLMVKSRLRLVNTPILTSTENKYKLIVDLERK